MSVVQFVSTISLCLFMHVMTAQTVLYPALDGEELQTALRNEFRPAFTLSLADAKDTLYSRVDNVQDSVEGIYSGYTLYLPPGEDASIWLYANGNGINLEHGYPQSKGADEGLPGHSNMHHLFPSRVAVNEARGSFPFAEIPDNTTTKWFRKGTSMSNIPTSEIDTYSESINGAFEPRESAKGNIARAIIYFYTMYKQDADAADPNFFSDQRTTLCAWHVADPIDDEERLRSETIAYYQDGKENPFVLDCSAAIRAWCPEFQGCVVSNTSSAIEKKFEFSAYAEGNRMIVNLQSEDALQVTLSVFDLTGRMIFATPLDVMSGSSEFVLNTRFPPGMYALTCDGVKQRLVTRCVVR